MSSRGVFTRNFSWASVGRLIGTRNHYVFVIILVKPLCLVKELFCLICMAEFWIGYFLDALVDNTWFLVVVVFKQVNE